MKQRAFPIIAIIAAVLFGIRMTPAPSSALPAPAAAEKPAQPITPAAAVPLAECDLKPDSLAKDAGPRLAATVANCVGAERKGSIAPIIVTLADPVRTSLGLLFDREMDAIQTAASQQHYLRIAHALPWLAGSKTTMKGPQVGLIVFRRDDAPPVASKPSADYVVLLVVPESPTRGVNLPSLDAAVDAIRILNGATPATLRIMGPRFSGSVKALKEFLEQRKLTAEAISGSVTASDEFQLQVREPRLGEIVMRATQTGDHAALERMVKVLQQDYHFYPGEIALVSEDETAYGKQAGTAEPHDHLAIQHYHFPREIARLRNAYAPMLARMGGPATNLAQQLLPDSLEDVHESRDEMPSFGGRQTPVLQDSQLMGIANAMKAQRIKVAGILATDTLDTLFLLQFFRRTCPDIRLFVRDPDLLYAHGADQFELNGVLAVNSFALFDRNQVWLAAANNRFFNGNAEGSNHRDVFSSAYDAADYYAFTELLQEINGTGPANVEYASVMNTWPGGGAGLQPPLWLTMLGPGGYQPLAILNPEDRPRAPEDASKPLPACQKKAVALSTLRALDPGRPPRFLAVVSFFVGVLGLLHLFAVTIARRYPRILPRSVRADFELHGEGLLNSAKAMCHSAALMTVAFAQLALGAAFIFFIAGGGYVALRYIPEYLAFASATVAISAALVIGSLLIYTKGCLAPCWRVRRSYHAWPADLFSIVIPGGVCLTVILGSMLVWAVYGLKANYVTMSLHLRDLTVAGGVAPVLPLVLLLAVIYGGAITHARRITYCRDRCPQLSPVQVDDLFSGDFAPESDGIERNLWKVPDTRYLLVLLAVLAALSVLFVPWRTLIGFEPLWVRFITLELFLIALVLLLLNWVRVMAVWSYLRRILTHLDRLPFRDAFGRLAELHSLKMWSWGDDRSAHCFLRENAAAVRELARLAPQAITQAHLADFNAGVKAIECPEDIAEKASAAAAAGDVSITITPLPPVRPPATTEHERILAYRVALSAVLDDVAAYAKQSYATATPPSVPAPGPNPCTFAEDLIAYRYYEYIRYVVTEIRNLIFYCAAAFTLLALAIGSYPFHGKATLSWMLITLLLLIAGGIVLVLSQMERDAILSRLQGSKPGELGKNFYLNVLRYGAVPLLSVVGSQFPQIAGTLSRWLGPSLDALR